LGKTAAATNGKRGDKSTGRERGRVERRRSGGKETKGRNRRERERRRLGGKTGE